jgi:hypothetical protein
MGVYIYTLRAKTVALHVLGTGRVRANLYCFAYRYTSYWKGDPGEKSYTFRTENAERNARNAFANYTGGHVIICSDDDLKEGIKALEGRCIYTNVTEPVYVDTVKFPGAHVGWVGVQGNGLYLSKQTPWRNVIVTQGAILGPQRQRLVMDALGQVTQEVIREGSDIVERPYENQG